MKSIRMYLSIAFLLLALAIGAGIYVWYLYQETQQSIQTTASSVYDRQTKKARELDARMLSPEATGTPQRVTQ